MFTLKNVYLIHALKVIDSHEVLVRALASSVDLDISRMASASSSSQLLYFMIVQFLGPLKSFLMRSGLLIPAELKAIVQLQQVIVNRSQKVLHASGGNASGRIDGDGRSARIHPENALQRWRIKIGSF